MKRYVKSGVRLKGEALDKELKKRLRAAKERIAQRLSFGAMADKLGIYAEDVLAWEYGYDICPHKKWEDLVFGIPTPEGILKRCKKCGMVKKGSVERINKSNMKRAYEAYKKDYKCGLKKDSK